MNNIVKTPKPPTHIEYKFIMAGRKNTQKNHIVRIIIKKEFSFFMNLLIP